MAVDTKELYEIREKSLKVEVSMINGAKLEERLNTKREDILELLEDVGSISEVTKK
ncbi:MAG: hypothetical protein H7Y18_17395, partial [Clostridiaceae bacterium]|nr:hypothetical protein [Clostridiaceae bacterium]